MPSANLLLCRPLDQSKHFQVAAEQRLGRAIDTTISPALKIEPLEVAAPDHPLSYLLFTSVHGVNRAKELGMTAAHGALCVGDSTAQAASRHGFAAESAGGNLSDLLELVKKKTPDGKLLHVSGEAIAGDPVGQLKNVGYDAERLIAYRQRQLPPTAEFVDCLKGSSPKVLPLFSPRSARIVSDVNIGENTYVIAMSDAIRDVLEESERFEVSVVESPNFEAMLAETCAKLTP